MNKAGFMKDALILFAITLIAGICLGGVYSVTKEPIAQAVIKKNEETYRQVFPDAAKFNPMEELAEAVRNSETDMASLGYGKVLVSDILEAVDESGNPVGYVVSSGSKDGFGGLISVSVGISNEGAITGVGFLSISETPGLGMNAQNPEFIGQFTDKSVDSFVVTKTGASADNEIDALSGATITSNAVTNAVNAALYFVANCVTN